MMCKLWPQVRIDETRPEIADDTTVGMMVPSYDNSFSR